MPSFSQELFVISRTLCRHILFIEVFLKFIQAFQQILSRETNSEMISLEIINFCRQQHDALLIQQVLTKFINIGFSLQSGKSNWTSLGGVPVKLSIILSEKPLQKCKVISDYFLISAKYLFLRFETHNGQNFTYSTVAYGGIISEYLEIIQPLFFFGD